MKIMIIRHADPDYGNHTLTKQGFLERDALGDYYKDYNFKKIYVSPLNRALFTLDGILNANPKNEEKVEVVSQFIEFYHQIYDPSVKTYKNSWDLLPQYYESNKELHYYDKYLDNELFKDSNIKQKYIETITIFDKILENHGYKREGNLYKVIKENKDTILIVCHLGMMNVLLSHLLNIPYVTLCQTFACPPTGVTLLHSEERIKGIASFRCETYGGTTHLKIKMMENSFAGRFCEVFSDPTRH